MPKYLAASSLVSTSFVQLIMFAVIRSATCFNSSLIVFVFAGWGCQGVGGNSRPHLCPCVERSRRFPCLGHCFTVQKSVTLETKECVPTVCHIGSTQIKEKHPYKVHSFMEKTVYIAPPSLGLFGVEHCRQTTIKPINIKQLLQSLIVYCFGV